MLAGRVMHIRKSASVAVVLGRKKNLAYAHELHSMDRYII